MNVIKKVTPFWITSFTILVAACTLVLLQVSMQYGVASAAPVNDPPLPGWITPTPTPVNLADITDVSKPPLVGGRIPDRPPVFVGQKPMPNTVAASAAVAPTIDLWYGTNQRFGLIGHPQPWINVLGNVTGTTGTISLTYSLNGGADRPLHVGPDEYRLANKGDFNIELAADDLNNGANTVEITATDSLTNVVTKTVTVRYNTATTWPLPTNVVWGDNDPLNEIAQVVDGKWTIDNDQLQPVELGYDRLIALGDSTWTDYEVQVPFMVKSIDPVGYIGLNNGPNIGFGIRWGGHFDAGNGTQPRSGWQNLGGLALYRWQPDDTEALQLFGFGGGTLSVNSDKQLAFDTAYIAKISVQSAMTGTAYYRFKLWPAAAAEPINWDMESFGLSGEPTSGSAVLQAHFADVRFGDVTVRPLSAIQPKLTIVDPDHGTITATPNKDPYAYGDRITLAAVPELGYQFVQWGDDISSTNSTLDIYMTKDTKVSATFVASPPPTIVYTTTANGSVTWTPKKDQYTYGEEVTFVATPEIGFMLAGWGGNIAGNANPLTLAIDRDLRIEPRFVPATAPFSDDFNVCALNSTYWSFVDPVGDTTFALNGTQVTINLPAGSDHDLWEDKNLAPRFMQTMEDSDFDLVTKFESLLTKQFQMQGMIIEQDANNFLRTDFYADINGMHVFAASFTDGTPNTHFSLPISPSGSQLYLRVTRTGDEWTIRYSFNGTSWTTAGTFTYAITATKAGFFAGNAAAGASPASTVVVDSFMNMSAPIVNEDGKPMSLSVDVNGNGAVDIAPSKLTYTCGEQIKLTAIPGDNLFFTGWSGSASGTTNPLTVNFTPGFNVVAKFEVVEVNFKLYLPVVAK